MKLNLIGIDKDLLNDIKELEKVLDVSFSNEGEIVNISTIEENNENDLEIGKGYIKYKHKHNLFRAIGLYIQLSNDEDFYKSEKQLIKDIGPMIDVSRNAVYKLYKVKELMLLSVTLGLNKFMLYTEDTYEIEGYEYFGYMRGRYSKEELKEIDKYGQKLGIEVVPCIQTLAHLEKAIKWEYAKDMVDSEDVLLVGAEKTYKFIEEMIKSLRDSFKSKNIHIGMDEAFLLGRGEYINKNGYKNHYDIMIEHLEKVCTICNKYDFKPMMWDDMILRSGSPNGFYYNTQSVIKRELANKLPENLSLVYWDYYHNDKNTYKKMWDIRNNVFNNKVFAGGVWKWSGFAPCYDQTFKSSNEALLVCKEENINEVIITAWGDNGDETPIDTIIPGLILFSEHAYNNDINMDFINKRCKFFTNLELTDFFMLQELDKIEEGDKENLRFVNPSKYLLYQDILLGAFDKHIEHISNLENHYSEMSKVYLDIANKEEKYYNMFKFYSDLAKVLSIKADLGINLRKSYKENNIKELKYISENILKDLITKIDILQDSFRRLWYLECKGQGFEVIDIRLGGVKSRALSTIYRINSYINNEIDKIEELEEDRLYFNTQFSNDSKQINYNVYKYIATQNSLV